MKDFVPYSEALVLNILGFDERCFLCYSKEGELSNAMTLNKTELNDIGFILAPTFSQAFRFFRDKYKLKSWVEEHNEENFIYQIRPHKLSDYKKGEIYVFNTYEEAELACLIKLIEIVKTKQL